MGPLWCGHISRRAKESRTEGPAHPKHSILDKQEGSHIVLSVMSHLHICPSSPPPYILYVLRIVPTNVSNCNPTWAR